MEHGIDTKGYNYRFNRQQWQTFARFIDFIYDQQRKFTQDLFLPVIVRAIGQSQISHDRGINASSLAEALDLPRETVRRKCLAAVEDGWLRREGDEFMLGDRVDEQVFAVFEDNLDRMLSATDRVRADDK